MCRKGSMDVMLSDVIDWSAKVDSVHCDRHLLRSEGGHVLRMGWGIEVDGHRTLRWMGQD